MATISISIIKSPMEVVAGIPTTVTLTSNVPSTIFYTLDGTTPTTSSLVAVGPIKLPTNQPSVELQAIATDGLTFSPVISELFGPTLVGARMPHDTVNLNQDCPGKATYPFGSPVASFNNPVIYGNTGEVIVDKVGETDHTPDGYDGTATGTPANYLSNPTTQFDFIFSETDSIGQMGRGIGTLPANVIWIKPRNNNNIQEQTNYGSKFFNPKALVVFQDSREEPYDPSLTKINRAYFDLEDPTKARDGTLLTADSITPFGSFVKAHYNSTDNTLTYYYYDNRVGRWIISKEPYTPKPNTAATNLSGLVWRSSRDKGVGFVFKWVPFKYRTLI